MKVFLNIVVLSMLKLSLGHSQSPQIIWQKPLGGTAYDMGFDINSDYNTGYLIASSTQSSDGDVNNNHGSSDAWIVNLDNMGNIVWQKCFGGTAYDVLWSIQKTADSCYLLAGNTLSNNGDVSGNHGQADFWLIKIDQNGNLLWQNCYGGTDDDKGIKIIPTIDGANVVVGYTSSNDVQVSGNHGSDDIWLIKIDSTGILQWQKCYGGSNDDYAYDIIQRPNGNLIISGQSSSNDYDISGNHGGEDGILMETDDNGNIIWQKSDGGTNHERFQHSCFDINGNIISIGYTLSNDGDVSGNHGNADAWLVKSDLTGNIINQICLGDTAEDVGLGIVKNSNNDFFISGRTGNLFQNYHGQMDYWILKLDSIFNLQGSKCLGG
ncbi:MAG: hypothetical protein ABI855_04815, partial [Bacteroidota bacterium]